MTDLPLKTSQSASAKPSQQVNGPAPAAPSSQLPFQNDSSRDRSPHLSNDPYRGSNERDVFFSEPRQVPSTSPPSVPSPQALRHWDPTTDRRGHVHGRLHRPAYVDRDDPRQGRSETITASRDQVGRRHRSRSPQPCRETGDQADRSSRSSSGQRFSVPWAELRTPASGHEALQRGPSSSSPVSTSKVPVSKHAVKAVSKRVATDISKWNRKQAELHASEPYADASPSGSQNPGLADQSASTSAAGAAAESVKQSHPMRPSESATLSLRQTTHQRLDAAQMSEAQLASYDYKDPARIACLLCQRKFKSLDTLQRHEDESQLHKENLANMDSCRQGVVRKTESCNEASSHASAPESGAVPTTSLPMPTYRDRASERRAVFGANTPSTSSHPNGAPRVFEGPESNAGSTAGTMQETPLSAPAKPIDSDNIGSKLLAMMGWTQGQGLGLKNQGRTDIVETRIYKPGAGLGSIAPTGAVAHEASSQATAHHRPGSVVAFSGYLNRAKDRARQRLAEHSRTQQ